MQIEPLRDLDLAAHDVDAGDHFGDGVFHLDARVHFDEVPLVGVGVDQELDCAGVVVTGGARQCDGRVGELGADSPVRSTAGATSTTFWWRRCTEQSRS